MNLLVISPAPSAPPNQGNRQRIHSVCKALQERGAKIHFGYLPREWGGKYDPDEQVEMTRQWDFFDTIVPSGQIPYHAKGHHHKIDEWWDEAIARYIRFKCTGTSFDACLVNYVFFSKAFEALPPNVVRILDTHDRMSGRRELLEQHGVAPEFFYTTEAEEKIALERADLVLAITEKEAAHFRTLTTKPVVTLGHIPTPQTPIALAPIVDRNVRLGFIGSANSVNTKNVSDFFEALAKSHPDGIPGVQFHIYGGCCPKIHIPEECAPYVHLHGFVDEVKSAYAAVDCVFIPFIFGTGQKIKLIEALSFGRPLIATASASEGSGSEFFYHQLTSHEEVIQAIQKFANELAFQTELASYSRQAFAAYEANVARATSALFAAANSGSFQALIEPKAVAKALAGQDRAGIVDQVCRVLAMLGIINLVGKLTNGDAATHALFQGAEDALVQGGSEQVESQARGLTLADGPTSVVFVDLCGDQIARSALPEIRVVLPGFNLAPETAISDSVDLYVDCRPAPGARESSDAISQILRTPTPEHMARNFARFKQVIVLVNDIQSAFLIANIRTFEKGVRQRSAIPFTISLVDAQARCATWTGGRLEQIGSREYLEQAIARSRELPRELPSIALAIGFSQTSAGALHRLLLADCGPTISLLAGRVIPVDGEVIARTAHEAALWSARFLNAPRWANTLARRTRASVAAIEGVATQAASLRTSFRAQLDKRMNSTFLMSTHEG